MGDTALYLWPLVVGFSYLMYGRGLPVPVAVLPAVPGGGDGGGALRLGHGQDGDRLRDGAGLHHLPRSRRGFGPGGLDGLDHARPSGRCLAQGRLRCARHRRFWRASFLPVRPLRAGRRLRRHVRLADAYRPDAALDGRGRAGRQPGHLPAAVVACGAGGPAVRDAGLRPLPDHDGAGRRACPSTPARSSWGPWWSTSAGRTRASSCCRPC